MQIISCIAAHNCYYPILEKTMQSPVAHVIYAEKIVRKAIFSGIGV